MKLNLKIAGILFVLLIVMAIVYALRKDKISIKYSLVWLVTSVILLLFIFFPELLGWAAKIFGFDLGANLIFTGLIALLMVITIVLTEIVSSQNEKIRLLIQEVSMLKGKNDEK
jgi:hypothetical protein